MLLLRKQQSGERLCCPLVTLRRVELKTFCKSYCYSLCYVVLRFAK